MGGVTVNGAHSALRAYAPLPLQVKDTYGAPDLVNADAGGISFENVHFGYVPDRKILKGLTFEAREARSRDLLGNGLGPDTHASVTWLLV